MASIKPAANGYRAQVYVKGVRDSKCFRTQREAKAWASARESEIREQAGKKPAEKYTLGDALIRYRDRVSSSKRGAHWESIRIAAFLRDAELPGLPINEVIGSITSEDLGEWRDARLKRVKPATVLREISLLSAVFEEARVEWKWITVNPIRDMRKPARPDHRDVVITRSQIKTMLRSLDYSPIRPIRSVTQAVAVTFLVALRSGMRARELCKLQWGLMRESWCVLPTTKTKPRHVPLTPKALRLIEKMRGFDPILVFGVNANSLDTLFRRARKRAGLSGFTFHDSRHTAATWLAPKLPILDLCKMFGWKDPKEAMIYYNPKASDIAKRIGA